MDALLFGVVIGASLGLLGGGGSILAVPALVYGLGQSVRQAVPTSLVVVGVAAAWGAAARLRADQVRLPLALTFAGAGALASLLGAGVHRALDERVVMAGFAVLMLVVGARMARSPVARETACAVSGGRNFRGCLPQVLAAGAAVGFLTGLFGVGGGFVVVPALVLLVGLDMPVAVGTSLVVIALNSAVALAAHLGPTALDVGLTVRFAGGAALGALLGARLSGRIAPGPLRRAFAVLVIALGVFVLLDSLIV